MDVFTDVAAERAALRTGAGLHVRVGRCVWRATGADATDYLHRMLTQDVAGVSVPGGTRACLLNRQGRVLGDFMLWRLAGAYVLDAEPPAIDHALPVLEKFVIADDVRFETLTATYTRFTLVGPGAADALAAARIEPPSIGACVSVTAADSTCHVLGVPHGEGVRFEFLAERAGATPVVDALFEDGRVQPVGLVAFDFERIRVREPRQPDELDDGILFNESQLESAVSWNKGCYPGQEPVIMAKHRGRPPRVLVGLEGAGPAPQPGDALSV